MVEYERWTVKNWREEKHTKAYDRLAELEDKIEQGTLIELPCKVGDEIYLVVWSGKECDIEIGLVTQFSVDESGCWVHMRDKYTFLHCIHTKSKGLFFTREEAEKRLKELQE